MSTATVVRKYQDHNKYKVILQAMPECKYSDERYPDFHPVEFQTLN